MRKRKFKKIKNLSPGQILGTIERRISIRNAKAMLPLYMAQTKGSSECIIQQRILIHWGGHQKGKEIIKGLKRCHFVRDPGGQTLNITKRTNTLYTLRWEENSMLQSFFRPELWFKYLSIRLISNQKTYIFTNT